MRKILSIMCGLLILISSVFNVNVCAKAEIPIAMCLDNNYTLPTIVAMTSMLENVKEGTEYKYYILVPGDFTDENKQKILSLKEKYKSKQFEINFINMKDEFKTAKQSLWGAAAYYRLRLPSMLGQYGKCIYLDGDTIVNKDLSELYNIDLEDNYVGGIRDFGMNSERAKDFGMKSVDKYINSGVLLMNLKKLRDDRLEDKFKWFVENNKEKLLYTDQDTLNVCCFDKIKILPLKYNFMEIFIAETNCLHFYRQPQSNEAFNNLVVIHYASNQKPWKNFDALFAEKWWKYAIKSGFYDKVPAHLEIKKKILEMRNNPKSSVNKTLDDGIYTISSKLAPNMCLDINHSSKEDKANLQLWQKNETDAQKFKIQYQAEGYYTIEAVCSGKFIDVSDSGKNRGTNIQQYNNSGTDAQKWFIVPDGEGYCFFLPKCNNLCMDVRYSQTQNGTNVWCWLLNASDAQRLENLRVNPGQTSQVWLKNHHNFDNIYDRK